MKHFLFLVAFFTSWVVFSQENNQSLVEGTKAYAKKDLVEAEAKYREAYVHSSKKAKAAYNLGTTIYKEKQNLESKKYFNTTLLNAKTKEEKFRAYHNLGNINYDAKDYAAAIDNYKNALRNNPKDSQTRYNLALAQKMFKEKPPQAKNDKGNNKDQAPKEKEKPSKDKDNNDKDKEKQKEKDKEQDKDNNDKSKQDKDENKQGKNNNQQPKSVKKSDLDNMLDAVNNEEQKVQEKVNGKKMKVPVKTDKDW